MHYGLQGKHHSMCLTSLKKKLGHHQFVYTMEMSRMTHSGGVTLFHVTPSRAIPTVYKDSKPQDKHCLKKNWRLKLSYILIKKYTSLNLGKTGWQVEGRYEILCTFCKKACYKRSPWPLTHTTSSLFRI